MTVSFRVWKVGHVIGGSDLSHPADRCVYLVDAEELVLINSGAGESFDQLAANIKRTGFTLQRLNATIVTHCYDDHAHALHQFQERFALRIIAHMIPISSFLGQSLWKIGLHCRNSLDLRRISFVRGIMVSISQWRKLKGI